MKFAILLLSAACAEKSSGNNFSMDGIAKAYQERFEREASSVSYRKVSSVRGDIVSIYQGAGISSFSQLYLVKDDKDSIFVIVYSAHCPQGDPCDLSLENVKVYDSSWKDVTLKILPIQEMKEKMGEVRKWAQYNEPGNVIDGFVLNLPEDETGELIFSLTPTSTYDPNAGNSFFEFGYCQWNPKKTKCEVLEKNYELSP